MNVMLHSACFVEQWRKLLDALYGYPKDRDAMVVTSVTGVRTSVYLPLLSYSDIERSEAEAMIEKLSKSQFQVRVLDGLEQSFAANDPVTMRLSLVGKTEDEILKSSIGPKCRNHIRKSEKGGMVLREGTDDRLVEDFYAVFSETMHRHGTPVFSRRLFQLMPEFVDARYLVVYNQGRAIAALCLVFDGKLAWVPWAGSLIEHRLLRANHLQYWSAIKLALLRGAEVFDFGRSAYLGATYQFKAEWGAKPVKLLLLTPGGKSIYEKYTLAAALWKKLPKWLVGRLGPVLCKYLPDL